MHTDGGTTSGSHAPSNARTLALAGIVGPVLFTVGVFVQEFIRSDEYDRVAQLISDLTVGPEGWMQQANFILFGLLMVAFAVALQRGVRSARTKAAGPLLIAGNGMGLIVAGIFPFRADASGLIYDPLGVHTVNGIVFFLSIGIALIVLAPRLKADPRWRSLSAYTLASGIALLILFVAISALARPAQAPLHPWLGLTQRLAVLVWLACIVTLSLRLRPITQPPAV